MSISNYTVPTNPYEDWRGSERRGFVPTARQKVILDAYAEAVATGLYYTKDIQDVQEALVASVFGAPAPMPAAAIPEWANTWRPDSAWLTPP